MESIPFRLALAVGALCAVTILAGCQSYQPKPLDAVSHREAWHKRTPADDSVVAFIKQLNEPDTSQPVRYNPGDGIGLAEGELLALVYNPDLRLARLRVGVSQATAEHAGLWDDPQLGFELLRITEGVSNPWFVATRLAVTLPISGRLEAEKERADAAYLAQLYAVSESEWRVRYQVRQSWLGWSATLIKIEQQRLLIDSIQSLVKATSAQADAGELSRPEAGLFGIELVQRKQELERLRGQAAEREQRLRGLLGLSPKVPLQLQPNPVGPVDHSIANELPSFDDNPALTRLAQDYEVAEQKLRREIRKQYPDFTIGPAYESDEGQSRIGLSGGIPLPIFNANQQGIAEAKAERELARAAYETRYEQLTGSYSAVQTRAKARSKERQSAEQAMAPMVDRQVADARRLLELGEGSGLVLLESMVRAHQAKMQLIALRLEEARAYDELRYLVGPVTKPKGNNTQTNPPSATAEEVSR